MSTLTLTKKRLFEGVWEGLLTVEGNAAALPKLDVTHQEQPIAGVQMMDSKDGKGWHITIPIPTTVVADGVQTILIRDIASGETLETVTIIAGEALADDIRAEVDLLRAELDMLKRAFRRHCLETT